MYAVIMVNQQNLAKCKRMEAYIERKSLSPQ